MSQLLWIAVILEGFPSFFSFFPLFLSFSLPLPQDARCACHNCYGLLSYLERLISSLFPPPRLLPPPPSPVSWIYPTPSKWMGNHCKESMMENQSKQARIQSLHWLGCKELDNSFGIAFNLILLPVYVSLLIGPFLLSPFFFSFFSFLLSSSLSPSFRCMMY